MVIGTPYIVFGTDINVKAVECCHVLAGISCILRAVIIVRAEHQAAVFVHIRLIGMVFDFNDEIADVAGNR